MDFVTFLDDAPYPRTNFLWKGKTFSGKFAPAAGVRFLRPEKLYVFLTKQAHENIYAKFINELPRNLQVNHFIIPPGSTEDELWEISRLVVEKLKPAQIVAYDISHGPLSFSLVGLLSAVFLHTTREIELSAVLYAAYGIDADLFQQNNKPQSGQQVTPLFDLREMLTWLEWFNAIERFNLTGEAVKSWATAPG